jgi:hypothetical protein
VISDIPAGTLVEVLRTRIVSEIMVVEHSDPMVLRRATHWERWRYWWRSRRVKANEIAAAAEAIKIIENAKENA